MRRPLQLALLAACTALVPPGASASVADAAFGHCVYDAVPLDGAWEMAYRTNAWSSTSFPSFKGKLVANAVPGYWS